MGRHMVACHAFAHIYSAGRDFDGLGDDPLAVAPAAATDRRGSAALSGRSHHSRAALSPARVGCDRRKPDGGDPGLVSAYPVGAAVPRAGAWLAAALAIRAASDLCRPFSGGLLGDPAFVLQRLRLQARPAYAASARSWLLPYRTGASRG